MSTDSQACTFVVESAWVEIAVEVFSLLADATRVRIVLALRDGEMPVNLLADVVDRSPSIVSQHLAKLRWGRIVTARQEGTRVFYSLADEHARQLVTMAVFQAQHAVQDLPGHHTAGHPSPEQLRAGGARK